MLGNDDLISITEMNITFTTKSLKENRHYVVIVTAFNNAGSATSRSENLNISESNNGLSSLSSGWQLYLHLTMFGVAIE